MALIKCSECGKEISSNATACPGCGNPVKGPPKPMQSNIGEGIGYILLLIPLISTLLIWFYVGSMTLIQNPGSTLNFIGIGTLIITAILAAYEASQLGLGKDNKKETGPVAYFLGILLLWIVVYPMYMYKRSKVGKKNLIVGSIFVAIIFAISWYAMGTAINERINEIRGTLGQ